jgi:hypothetical protein
MLRHESVTLQLGRAEEMLGGMAVHAERLARRGMGPEFVAGMKQTLAKALQAHHRSLAYKARMMEQTNERNRYLEELHALYAEVRKQVKIELPYETWREFGITDQR